MFLLWLYFYLAAGESLGTEQVLDEWLKGKGWLIFDEFRFDELS